jgi:hypothetical protein
MTGMTKPPLTITREAREYAARLKLEEPLQSMLQHVSQNVAGVRAVRVYVSPPYESDDDVRVILAVTLDATVDDRVEQEFGRWQIANFSPDVFQHFVFLAAYA